MRFVSHWCLGAALLLPCFPLAAQDAAHERLALDIYRELIETDTTHSTGSTTVAAEAMAAHLLAAGFERSDVRVLEELPRKGNLIARYRGRGDGARPLLLLSHLDVVEADPADWTVHPFEFLERDGYYYGRGTLDDKDEAAIYVANFLRMRAEGFVPDRDIILALTADEEGGDDNGVEWLVEHHRDLIDAEFALNEGGGGAIRNGRRISNNVQTTEKVYQSFALEVSNAGGHSSLPVDDNAIYRLADALARIRDHEFPVELNETTRAFFRASAGLQDAQLGAAMRGVLESPPDPAAVERLSSMPVYNAQLRTTCVATQLSAGHAENALPQRARATVNCRILPGQSPDAVQQTLDTLIADDQVVISPLDIARPSDPSPLAETVIGPIERITEDMWPGIAVVPTMSAGATDALYLRNVGIPTYGVSGVFSDIDDNRAHGRDERMLVTSFFEAQEFLYRLVRTLSVVERTN
jgi:acetylornithine deacetylase/succinyl-diaminopimelate desuccinylase-like protein